MRAVRGRLVSADLAQRAREVARLIHDDYTLQIGEPVAHAHIDALLACIEAHVAAALAEVQSETRAATLAEVERATRFGKVLLPHDSDHTRFWSEGFNACLVDVRRALGLTEPR